MIITPQSDFKLLKCPLELSQDNQLNFANKNTQRDWFNTLASRTFDNFTYIRKDNVVRVPALVDDLWNYNYCMYRNEGFGDKWFYAFVTRIEYVNPNCTNVYIKTDPWQTWQFDLTWEQCFVEREHTVHDYTGLHTVPENLETGPMVQCANSVSIARPRATRIVFQVSEVIDSLNGPDNRKNGGVYAGIFSGLTMFWVANEVDARRVIQLYQSGKEEALVAIFYAIEGITPGTETSTTTNGATVHWITDTGTSMSVDQKTVNHPSYLGGQTGPHYVPKNNKLFCWPYNYVRVTNNTGQDADFRYEDFVGNPSFRVKGSLCQGCSLYLQPLNYLGSESGSGVRDWGLVGGKLPILGWATDYYTNWETQNAVNLPLQAVSGGVSAIGSFLSGNIGGAISSLGETIANNVSQVYEAKLHPDQARGNANCGDINYSDGFTCFEAVPMSIKYEYAEIIDKYFTMFGYKVNNVKTPQYTSRPNHNYLKTNGCSFKADCPQDDAAEIKAMFDRGVCIWHNPKTFGDYSQNNKAND